MTTPTFNSNLEAAIYWLNYGFKVIPIMAGQKKPALPYSPWLDDLSIEAVQRHWSKNPTHGVGCVLPDDVVVFDADTPEAEAA